MRKVFRIETYQIVATIRQFNKFKKFYLFFEK